MLILNNLKYHQRLLWSVYIKDVGDKIFKSNSANAAELKDNIDKTGLETKDLKVEVEGDKVVLAGSVKDKETLEKAILAAGNNAGIASVDTSAVKIENADQPDSEFYEVQKGDNLSKISKKYYGDPNKYMVIFEANKPMLTDPDKIYPGQKLRIPALKK